MSVSGAKINVTNILGASALVLAATNGKLEVVEALVREGNTNDTGKVMNIMQCYIHFWSTMFVDWLYLL